MATDAKSISLDKAREDDAKFYWLADGYAPGGFVKPSTIVQVASNILDRAI